MDQTRYLYAFNICAKFLTKPSANVKEIRYGRVNPAAASQGEHATVKNDRAGRNRKFSKFKPWNPEVRAQTFMTLSPVSNIIYQMSAEQPVVCVGIHLMRSMHLTPLSQDMNQKLIVG